MSQPLAGRRVLVTRASDQAAALTELLAEFGALPIELPAIEIRPMTDQRELDRAIGKLADYDWLIFTSVNGVKHFCDRQNQLDATETSRPRIGAIGPATAKALAERGFIVSFQPPKYVAEAVVAGLKELGVAGKRFLVPRAKEAREVLVEELIAAGAAVDEVAVYETVRPAGVAGQARELFANSAVDIVTFTSSSTVRNLIALLDGEVAALSTVTIACIGPITADTAREHGLHVDVEAPVHTIPGLLQAIVEWEKEKAR